MSHPLARPLRALFGPLLAGLGTSLQWITTFSNAVDDVWDVEDPLLSD